MENGHQDKRIGTVIQSFTVKSNKDDGVVQNSQLRNLLITIQFLQNWYDEMFDTDNKSLPAVLMYSLIELLYIIKNSTHSDVEEEMYDLIEKYEKLKILFSGEYLNNASLQEFSKIIQNFSAQNSEMGDLQNRINLQQAKVVGLEKENQLLREQLNGIVEKNNEPINRLIHAVNNPNGSLQIGLKQTRNKLGQIDEIATGFQNTATAISKTLNHLEKLIEESINQTSLLSAPIQIDSIASFSLEDLQASMDDINKQMDAVSKLYDRLSNQNMYWLELKSDIQNRILPGVELILRVDPEDKYAVKKRFHCLEVIKQLESYIFELTSKERLLTQRVVLLNSKLEKLKNIEAELTAEANLIIEPLDINLTTFVYNPVKFNPPTKNRKGDKVTADIKNEFIPKQLLGIPQDPLEQVGDKYGLTVQEVLVLTLYDLLPKENDPTKNRYSSIWKILWKAVKLKIIVSNSSKEVDAVYSWSYTFSGKKDLFYENHPQLRKYLEYKPLSGGMASFRRTATMLPWDKTTLIDINLLSRFQKEIKSE